MKYKKIILVSHEMTYTGAPRSLLNLSRVLMEFDCNVEVYTCSSGAFEKEFGVFGIEVKPIELLYGRRDLEDSIVILNTIFSANLISSFASDRVRTILFIREAKNLEELSAQTGVDAQAVRSHCEIVCVSDYSADYVKKAFSEHEVSILHNYVEDLYTHKLNFSQKGMINYLISGTYEKRKGFDIAVKAFVNMPESLKAITRLHIVGPRPQWSKEYREQVASGYDDRIVEHGEITDEAERLSLYGQMNVFVISSRDEACSLVALEGAMLGKLIIMSENVGARYLLNGDKWIYPTEDVDALCRKMCNATSRRELLIEGLKNRMAYVNTSTKRIYKKNVQSVLGI